MYEYLNLMTSKKYVYMYDEQNLLKLMFYDVPMVGHMLLQNNIPVHIYMYLYLHSNMNLLPKKRRKCAVFYKAIIYIVQQTDITVTCTILHVQYYIYIADSDEHGERYCNDMEKNHI